MPVNIRRNALKAAFGSLYLTVALIGISVLGPPAHAQRVDVQYRRAQPYVAELPPTEARGCYFYRGRRYCGAYCYWEVNGKRYCQRRERDAHSQAPLVEDFDYGPVLK